jgi:hypothetical protein
MKKRRQHIILRDTEGVAPTESLVIAGGTAPVAQAIMDYAGRHGVEARRIEYSAQEDGVAIMNDRTWLALAMSEALRLYDRALMPAECDPLLRKKVDGLTVRQALEEMFGTAPKGD